MGVVVAAFGVAPAASMASDISSRAVHHEPPTKIDRITFSGGPTNPKITIYGQELGNRPIASPAGGTSNLGKCGPIAGNTGNDYGDELWVSDQSQLWSAGYTPYVDCMGLVIVRYSEHRIVLRLGSFYAIHYATRNDFGHGIYELMPGDTFQVTVEGARALTTVVFGDQFNRARAPW